MSKRTLLTVRQFSEKHVAFTQAGLRWVIFNEKSNGLFESGAIVRVGRRVLIDESRFFGWIDSINGIADDAA
jgi:hypothetical protein